jgi:hypothetical protein
MIWRLIYKLSAIIVLLSVCYSCHLFSQSGKTNNQSKIGDTIIFSDSLEIMKDGVLERLDISKELENELKIINIISGDCGKCIDQITNWDTVLKNTDRDIGIAFIINTHDINYFNKMLAPTISLKSANYFFTHDFYKFSQIVNGTN